MSPRKICFFTLALAAIILLFSTAFLSQSAYALTDDEVILQMKEIKANIESAQTEYLAVQQQTAEIESEKQLVLTDIANLTQQATEARAKLESLCAEEYKSSVSGTVLISLLESGDLTEMLRQIQYANKIAEQRSDVIAQINETEQKLTDSEALLEQKQAVAEEAEKSAEEAKNTWKSKLNELKPQIDELRNKYLSQMGTSSGSEQLSAALNYLDSIDGATEAQVAIVRAAYSTSYAGSNYCERWVDNVMSNAGYSMGRYESAAADMRVNMKSTDLSNIPAGALVFGSGSGYMGALYGHVGICVAAGTDSTDALIMDNEGSSTMTAVPLSQWATWQTAYSSYAGKSGVIGWGYPSSVGSLEAVR